MLKIEKKLKTLKDIEKIAMLTSFDMWEKLAKSSDKNIILLNRERTQAVKDVLKEEAIKWIKSFRIEAIKDFKNAHKENIRHSTFFQKWDLDKLTDEEILKIWEEYQFGMYKYNLAKISWIKHFFNISSEEIE